MYEKTILMAETREGDLEPPQRVVHCYFRRRIIKDLFKVTFISEKVFTMVLGSADFY